MTGLQGDVKLPGVGDVSKKWLAVAGVGIVGYVGWRYYSASSGDAGEEEFIDPGMEGTEILPVVPGAVAGVGLSTSASGSEDNVDTNAEWVASVREQLSGTYSDTAIVSALALFLEGRPLTSSAQAIVQAALAVAGYPPVGSHTIKSGGDSVLKSAPTGLKQTGSTSTTATISWSEVAGADEYRLYRTDVGANVGSSRSTTGQIGGLDPAKSYSVYVRALTAAGEVGPKSATLKVTTAGDAKPKAPSTPVARGVTRTGLTLTWREVAGAVKYEVYRNGSVVASPTAAYLPQSGLKPNTTYRYQVVAVAAGGAKSTRSGTETVKTKK